MMYQLTKSSQSDSAQIIKRIPDNIFFPADPTSPTYREYLQWLEEGNVPLPPSPPVIGDIQDFAVAKPLALDAVRAEAYGRLQPTDWVVTREMETGAPAPADITTYRAAVRAAADEKVATIESADDLDTLTTYLRSEEFTSWPDAPSV